MLLPLLLCYGGFAALYLSMDRHHRDLLGSTPSARRRQGLKVGGWLLQVLALGAAVALKGWAMGLVLWSAVLMFSGLFMVLLLPYRPRLVLALAGVSVLLSPIAAFTQL